MVASSLDSGTTDGVAADHCYMVHSVDQRNGDWYVRLYNPWGHDTSGSVLFDMTSTGYQSTSDEGLITLTWTKFTANFAGFSWA